MLIEEKFRQRHRWVFSLAIILTCCYAMIFSMAVMVLQRQAFGDVKASARYIRDNIPPETLVYSNEMYKPEIVCPKMRFWSGRPVEFFQGQPLPADSILVLHTAYGGSAGMDKIHRYLVRNYRLIMLAEFEASILPLLPDIMGEPISHQNPLAWVFRYQPQTTITSIYQVEPRTQLE